MQEQRGAERPQPLRALVQLLAAAGTHRQVEAASEEAALAASEPGGQLLGVLGGRGDERVGQQAALAFEPAGRLEPGALAAQSLGGDDGRDRLDVQRDVGVAGGAQQWREPATGDLARVGDDGEGGQPALADADAVALELECRRPEQRA